MKRFFAIIKVGENATLRLHAEWYGEFRGWEAYATMPNGAVLPVETPANVSQDFWEMVYHFIYHEGYEVISHRRYGE